MTVKTKRIYEPASVSDGNRVLVDRLWPRGITSRPERGFVWMREVSPSTSLRKKFSHEPDRWEEFRREYRCELCENTALGELAELSRNQLVTLLYAARDIERNNAVVLKEILDGYEAFLEECPCH